MFAVGYEQQGRVRTVVAREQARGEGLGCLRGCAPTGRRLGPAPSGLACAKIKNNSRVQAGSLLFHGVIPNNDGLLSWIIVLNNWGYSHVDANMGVS